MSEQKFTRREQAEQLLQHPNMRRYLDLLSYTEGTEKHGYNTTFGGKRWEDLSHHPNKVWGRTGDGPTTATGRYQFLGSTWQEQEKLLGLKDFGGHSQDLAAVSLIMGRGAVDDILKGDIDTANRKLSKTWASLPYNDSPHQSQKSVADVQRKWELLQHSGGLGQMDGQTYDFSTTPEPENIAVQQPVLQNFAQATPLDQIMQPHEEPINDHQKQQQALAQSFYQLNDTFGTPEQAPTLTVFEPPEPPDYSEKLASAFGIAPSTQGKIPDYIGDMIKSIYDQTA